MKNKKHQMAFPHNINGDFGLDLTKRQWYAGMALQGLIINRNHISGQAEYHRGLELDVMWAFDYADTMIKHEEKENQ